MTGILRPVGGHGENKYYQQHRRRGQEACTACKAAHAAKARSSYGPTRSVQPCGTRAAYRRHLAHGEDPCAACRTAHDQYNAELALKCREDRRDRQCATP